MTFDPTELNALLVSYGLRLLAAVAVLVVGLLVVRILLRFIHKLMAAADTDPSLTGFIRSLVSILLRIMVYITAIGMLGVEMTSFIAILGAAGLAVGMALSGTLQNFAGGVMILLFKPYKVGDFIEAQGYSGSVKEIQIFTTVLSTGDNRTVLIPNGPLSTDALINYSTQETRRVEWTFSIAYGDDLDQAYALLQQFVEADSRIEKEPEPFMALAELSASSVDIVLRAWVRAGDYWPVYHSMNEKVYRQFGAAGLSNPLPQFNVTMPKV